MNINLKQSLTTFRDVTEFFAFSLACIVGALCVLAWEAVFGFSDDAYQRESEREVRKMRRKVL